MKKPLIVLLAGSLLCPPIPAPQAVPLFRGVDRSVCHTQALAASLVTSPGSFSHLPFVKSVVELVISARVVSTSNLGREASRIWKRLVRTPFWVVIMGSGLTWMGLRGWEAGVAARYASLSTREWLVFESGLLILITLVGIAAGQFYIAIANWVMESSALKIKKELESPLEGELKGRYVLVWGAPRPFGVWISGGVASRLGLPANDQLHQLHFRELTYQDLLEAVTAEAPAVIGDVEVYSHGSKVVDLLSQVTEGDEISILLRAERVPNRKQLVLMHSSRSLRARLRVVGGSS